MTINNRFVLFFKILSSITLVIFLGLKLEIDRIQNLTFPVLILILLSCFVTLISLFVMSCRWYLLCKGIHVSPNLIALYSYYIKGSFYNIFLPGAIGGDVVRTKSLINNHDINLKQATSITIAERVSGLYMLFFMGVLGLLLFEKPKSLNLYVEKTELSIIFSVIILFVPIIKWIISRKVKTNYSTILPVLVLSFIGQLGDVFIAWMFCQHFELSIHFHQLLIIMPIVYFATVLPISLGGLGVREGVFVAVLALYSIESSTAVLISFLMYFVKLLIGVIGWLTVISSKSSPRKTEEI